MYAYVQDPTRQLDPAGLASCTSDKKLYRYASEGEVAVIRRTGKIPNVDRAGNPKQIYLTDRKYETAGRAKTHLQLPEKPAYRIEIDPADVPRRTPTSRVEPHHNPQWGIGRGTETTTADAVPVDLGSITKLKGAP